MIWDLNLTKASVAESKNREFAEDRMTRRYVLEARTKRIDVEWLLDFEGSRKRFD